MKSHRTFIAINPFYKNMGIASRIIEEMLMILKEKGMISVELVTDSDNIAARSLYKKRIYIN